MKRLNIFVDETGEFGFGNGASELYGVSFTFHEQKDDITVEILKFNERLTKIGYTKMIHMADLIMKRGDYKNFSISKRKSIFNAIYQFSRKIPIKYQTIIIDKKYTKFFTFTPPPKTMGKTKGILLMNKNEDDFDEIFNKLADLFYYVSD